MEHGILRKFSGAPETSIVGLGALALNETFLPRAAWRSGSRPVIDRNSF